MFNEEQVADGQTGEQGEGVDLDVGLDTTETQQPAQETKQVDDLDSRLDKHPRFQEVYKKMKDYESKLAEFEKKSTPQTEDPDLATLVKWGFDKEKAIAFLKMLEARAERKILPLQESERAREVDATFNKFFSSHPEADKEVIAEMEKLFDGLRPEIQQAYRSDLSSLDMLLSQAEKNLGRSYQKGKTDAISQAKRKKDGGSITGSSANDVELTEDVIKNMTPAEFKRREPEIMAKLKEAEESGE